MEVNCRGYVYRAAISSLFPKSKFRSEVEDFPALPTVVDVHNFGNVRSLSLHDCRSVTDVGALGNLHTLELSCCGVSDVSPLSMLHTLFLTRCNEVSDVSHLGGLHSLFISECKKVKNSDALGSVNVLGLEGCSITDVNSLTNVRILSLKRCTSVTNVTALGNSNIVELHLEGCTGITDVSGLGNVHTLNLRGCLGVDDVSTLGSVHTLCLRNCRRVSNVNNLGAVCFLDIIGCSGLSDISPLSTVQVIWITADADALQYLSILRLELCGREGMDSCLNLHLDEQNRCCKTLDVHTATLPLCKEFFHSGGGAQASHTHKCELYWSCDNGCDHGWWEAISMPPSCLSAQEVMRIPRALRHEYSEPRGFEISMEGTYLEISTEGTDGLI